MQILGEDAVDHRVGAQPATQLGGAGRTAGSLRHQQRCTSLRDLVGFHQGELGILVQRGEQHLWQAADKRSVLRPGIGVEVEDRYRTLRQPQSAQIARQTAAEPVDQLEDLLRRA